MKREEASGEKNYYFHSQPRMSRKRSSPEGRSETEELDSKPVKAIRFFSKGGDKDAKYLSNYWPAKFTWHGQCWDSAEHYYQSRKFVGVPGAEWWMEAIRNARTPHTAKELGGLKAGRWSKPEVVDLIKKARSQGVKVRGDWERVKEAAMREALEGKFGANALLREKLLATGDADLLEASPYDAYWGIGREGDGQNRLGVLLMQLRDEWRRTASQ